MGGGFGLWLILFLVALFLLVLVYGFGPAVKILLGVTLLSYLCLAVLSGIYASCTNYRHQVSGLSQKEIFIAAGWGALRSPVQSFNALFLGHAFPGVPLIDPSVAAATGMNVETSDLPGNPMIPIPDIPELPQENSTGGIQTAQKPSGSGEGYGMAVAEGEEPFVAHSGATSFKAGDVPRSAISSGHSSLLVYGGIFSLVTLLATFISKGNLKMGLAAGFASIGLVFFYQLFSNFFFSGDGLGFPGFLLLSIVVIAGTLYCWVRFIHARERFKKWLQTVFLLDPDKGVRDTQDIGKVFRDLQGLSIKVPTPQKIEEYGTSESDTFWFGCEFESSQGFTGRKSRMKDHVISEKMVGMHTFIAGGTGAGKTSRILLPLAMQIIGKGYGLCFVTFKRDPAIVGSVAAFAKKHGKRFHYFSLNPEEVSEGYNPLTNGSPGSLSARIVSALDMPTDGAAAYYTAVQEQALTSILEWTIWEGKKSQAPAISLRDVNSIMNSQKALRRIWKTVEGEDLPQETSQNLKGLGARIKKLISGSPVTKRLNTISGISLPEIMRRGDVVYFNLESNANPALATALGRMLMFDLREACSSRSESSTPFHLIIDEFQDVACDSLSDLIAKIRSAQIPLTLATQSLAQIANVSEEFMNTVLSVTATKIVMQQTNPDEIDLFARMSGSVRYTERQESIADGVTYDSEEEDTKHKSSFAMEFTTAGRLAASRTFAVDPNIFLSMREGMAVVFTRGEMAKICMFGYATDKNEMEAFFEDTVQKELEIQLGKSSPSEDGETPPWEYVSEHPIVRSLLDPGKPEPWVVRGQEALEKKALLEKREGKEREEDAEPEEKEPVKSLERKKSPPDARVSFRNMMG